MQVRNVYREDRTVRHWIILTEYKSGNAEINTPKTVKFQIEIIFFFKNQKSILMTSKCRKLLLYKKGNINPIRE